MYYRISDLNININNLQNKLSKELPPEYKVYFKKGSRFKFLQFIGRKDSLIVRRNSLYGFKLYLIKTPNYCDISIENYIPSSILRNNPIPLGIWTYLISLFNRIDENKFRNDTLEALDKNFNGQLRE